MSKTSREARDTMVSEGGHFFGIKDDKMGGWFEESTGFCCQDQAMKYAILNIKDYDPEFDEPCTPLLMPDRVGTVVDYVLLHIEVDPVVDCDCECCKPEGAIW